MSGEVAKRGPGRPSHNPTPEQRAKVLALKGIGANNVTIAKQIGICRDTLTEHYAEELEAGPDFANSLVAQKLHTIAVGGEKGASYNAVVRAATFWMERRAGWSKDETKKPAAAHGVFGGPVVPPSRRIMFVLRAPTPKIAAPIEATAEEPAA